MGTVNRAVAKLAARQFGVLSREQGLAVGLTKGQIEWLLSTGAWERLHRGVYRIAGAPSSWHQSLMALQLAAGPAAIVSHRSAANLFELEGIQSTFLDISIIEGLRRAPPPGAQIHRVVDMPRSDWGLKNPFRLTTPTRTLIDLAAVVTEEPLEIAMEDAFRRGLTAPSRLRRRIDSLGRQGRRGAGVIAHLLEVRGQVEGPADSVLEVRFFRLLKRSGLPLPEKQHKVFDSHTLVARIDFAYVPEKVAIEAEGYRYHSGKTALEEDMHRQNLLTGLGWRVLRFNWDDVVRRPEKVIAGIRRALTTKVAEHGSQAIVFESHG